VSINIYYLTQIEKIDDKNGIVIYILIIACVTMMMDWLVGILTNRAVLKSEINDRIRLSRAQDQKKSRANIDLPIAVSITRIITIMPGTLMAAVAYGVYIFQLSHHAFLTIVAGIGLMAWPLFIFYRRRRSLVGLVRQQRNLLVDADEHRVEESLIRKYEYYRLRFWWNDFGFGLILILSMIAMLSANIYFDQSNKAFSILMAQLAFLDILRYIYLEATYIQEDLKSLRAVIKAITDG
jgi:hypothetical protein